MYVHFDLQSVEDYTVYVLQMHMRFGQFCGIFLY